MSQYYILHSRTPWPFGFWVRKAMEEMGIDDFQIVLRHPVPAVDLRPYIDATVRSCWQDRFDAVRANKLRQRLVRHLIVKYPSLGDLRRRHLSEYRVGGGSYCFSQVLGEEACSVGGNTLSYVEEAGLLHKI
ncbi:hypothetical protein Pcinc_003803 [Petrolisthes cinctipes]|uniref:Uncharacterized protein n=1 Tax=Petrolisthes cinctipes TaxID=88211 RepID=A0AAE1GGN6_PETCI|nr:hypothetical protein Pcinc_003803 [Petrolisthes cinctipes]